MKIIDLTHLVTNGMPVFPGDNPPKLERGQDEGNMVHYYLESGMHVGTHIDGPLHFVPGGKKLSEIEVSKFVARGNLIDARGKSEIDVDLLEGRNIKAGDCVLVHTDFDKKFGESSYYEDYPVLTEAFAQKLVELKINFIGLDTPSPDKAPYTIHPILLKEEILIIENMKGLDQLLGVDEFEVVALPGKFDAEAGLARVIARIL